MAQPALAASGWGQGPRALSSPWGHTRADQPFPILPERGGALRASRSLSAPLRAVPGRAPCQRSVAHTLLSRALEALASASNCQSCPLGSRTMPRPRVLPLCFSLPGFLGLSSPASYYGACQSNITPSLWA